MPPPLPPPLQSSKETDRRSTPSRPASSSRLLQRGVPSTVTRYQIVDSAFVALAPNESVGGCSVVAYEVAFDGRVVYVCPTGRFSSCCEALLVVSASYGGLGADANYFWELFSTANPFLSQIEFMAAVNAVELGDFIVTTDRKTVLREISGKMLNKKGNSRLKLSTGPASHPTFRVVGWPKEVVVGSTCAVEIFLEYVPEVFPPVQIYPTCSSGGVLFSPEVLYFDNSSGTGSSYACLRIVTQKRGDHNISFRVSASTGVPDVVLPPPHLLCISSHEQAVLQSAIDTLCLLLDQAVSSNNFIAFRYAVSKVMNPSVSLSTLRDVFTGVLERGQYALFKQLLGTCSMVVLDRICNFEIHNLLVAHWCIIFGDVSLVVRLLMCGSFDLGSRGMLFCVALAVGKEDLAVDLTNEIPAIAVDGYFGGSTALCVAVSRGMRLAVKRLVRLGADINAHDHKGDTPLFLCWDKRDVSGVEVQMEIMNEMLQTGQVEWSGVSGAKNTAALLGAARCCVPAAVAALIAAGCPVQGKFCSPLLALLSNKNGTTEDILSTAKVLVNEAATSLDLVGPMGSTVLQIACAKADINIIQILLASGVRTTILDHDKKNCFHYLLAPCVFNEHGREEEGEGRGEDGGRMKILEVLIGAMQDPKACNVQDAKLRTPLHLACGCVTKQVDIQIVTKLIECGHIATLDYKSRSPMHYALSCPGVTEACLSTLLSSFKNDAPGLLALSPPDQSTILQLCIERGYLPLVQVLCKRFRYSEDDMFQRMSHSGFTPLLSALIYPFKRLTGGDPMEPLSKADRERGEAMAMCLLAVPGCSVAAMLDAPYASPLHVAAARCYQSVILELLMKNTIQTTTASDIIGATPISALLGVPPYDTPLPFSDEHPEGDIADRKKETLRLLVSHSFDELSLIACDKAPSGSRVLIQVLCDVCNPEYIAVYLPAAPMQWEYTPALTVAEHPLSLIVQSKAAVADKDIAFDIMFNIYVDELRLEPSILMYLCQRCIELGLDTHLCSLIGLHKMVTEAMLSGGISLLQYALTVDGLEVERREAVCDVLIKADVKVNTLGVADCGTALQECIKKNLWNTIDALCKPTVKVNASLVTTFEPAPPIVLCIEKLSEFPNEATGALIALLSTHTVLDVSFEDSSSSKVNIAAVCCAKGIASVIAPLSRAGLLLLPTSDEMEVPQTTLAHRAIAPLTPSVPNATYRFGAGATLAALADVGYLCPALELEDEKGFTPLSRACVKGNPEAVALLLKKGARGQTKDNNFPAKLLIMAPMVDDVHASECLALLLGSSSMLSYLNYQFAGDTLLHHACERGLTITVGALLATNKVNSNSLNQHGHTALICVLRSGVLSVETKIALVNTLFQCQFLNPTIGGSPLHSLIEGKVFNQDLITLLLEKDLALCSRSMLSLEVAGICPVQAYAKWLAECVCGEDAGDAGVAYSCFDCVLTYTVKRNLLQKTAHIALHVLSAYPCDPVALSAARLLASKGVPCNMKDSQDSSALQRLLRALQDPALQPSRDTIRLLELLIDAKDFDPNIKDAKHRTLLHLIFDIPHDAVAVAAASRVLAYYTNVGDTCNINAVDLRERSILSQLTKSSISQESIGDILSQLLQINELKPRLAGLKGTILHFVCSNSSPSVIGMCLDSPVLRAHLGDDSFWELRDTNNRTAVQCVVARPQRDGSVAAILTNLLEYSDVLHLNGTDAQGLTPLFAAIQTRQWKVAMLLAKARVYRQGNAVLSPCGASALHWIIRDCDSPQEAVTWVNLLAAPLVEQYGSLDAVVDDAGDTVLHHAARRCFGTVCELLINRHCCAAFGGSTTPLHLCLAQHSTLSPASAACASAILRAGTPVNAVHGDPELLSLINKQTTSGQTALMMAAQNGHLEPCKHLIKLGVDILITDEAGHSALQYAFRYEVDSDTLYEEFVMSALSLMQQASAGEALKALPPEAIVFRAIERSSLNLLKLLHSFGCPLFVTDAMNCTSLDAALKMERRNLAEFLRTPRKPVEGDTNTEVQTDHVEPLALHKPSAATPHEILAEKVKLAGLSDKGIETCFGTPIPKFILSCIGSRPTVQEEAPISPISPMAPRSPGSPLSPNQMHRSFLQMSISDSIRPSFEAEVCFRAPLASPRGRAKVVVSSFGTAVEPQNESELKFDGTLKYLCRTDEEDLCLRLASGEQPIVVAQWLESFGLKVDDANDEVASPRMALRQRACVNHLQGQKTIRETYPHLVEAHHAYATFCNIDTTLPDYELTPLGCGERLRRTEENVFMALLTACPRVLLHSTLLLNRFTVRLLHARLGCAVSVGMSPIMGTSLINESSISCMSPVSLMLLSTSSAEMCEAILPPNGLYASGGGMVSSVAALFQAAIVFINTTVMKALSHIVKDRADSELLQVAVERGTVEAVVTLLSFRVVQGDGASQYDTATLADSFLKRPLQERTWDIFEVLLHNRIPLTTQSLLYIMEEGRIGYRTALGDTVLHIMALNDQHELLEGFLVQVPHLTSSPLQADAKNMFGKTATHYSSHAFLVPLSTISKTAKLARKYESVFSEGDNTVKRQQYESLISNSFALFKMQNDKTLLRRVVPKTMFAKVKSFPQLENPRPAPVVQTQQQAPSLQQIANSIDTIGGKDGRTSPTVLHVSQPGSRMYGGREQGGRTLFPVRVRYDAKGAESIKAMHPTPSRPGTPLSPPKRPVSVEAGEWVIDPSRTKPVPPSGAPHKSRQTTRKWTASDIRNRKIAPCASKRMHTASPVRRVW